MTHSPTVREGISKILIKWDMPTRQAAINEIISLITEALPKKKDLPKKSEWSELPFWTEFGKCIGFNQAIDLMKQILEGKE